MAQPVLLAIEDDQDALIDIERELRDRYDRSYTVECTRSPERARELLGELAAAGTDVALVLAAQWLQGSTGSSLLDGVRELHPHARRALVIGWGEWGEKALGDAIFEGISHGRFDHYVIRPSCTPDEQFHTAISGLLLEWSEERRTSPYTVHVVGASWSGRAYELRETLQHCAISHDFCLADTERGRAFVESAPAGSELPLVVMPNGIVLSNPSNAEIALAAGSPVDPAEMESDVVIVGAGPAGLSAAVYGASEGFDTLVVDKGGIGGQATSSSLIRNYLGFPRGLSGRRLAQAAYDQAWVFGSGFAFMQTVTGLARDGDQLVLTLSESGQIRTTAVLLAMGASYNRIGVASLEALAGAGVYYGGPTSEAPGTADCDVFVVGGANSAGQAALHLARYARTVTLVVRANSLHAGMSDYLVRQVAATPNIEVRLRTAVVDGGGDAHLEHLTLQDRATGAQETVAAQALFLLIGAHPFTEWLPSEVERDAKGFVLTGSEVLASGRWSLQREPFALETSMPGVFAAGDVRNGSVKRVASAVGEGSIAVQQLHGYFAAEQRLPRNHLRAASGSVPR